MQHFFSIHTHSAALVRLTLILVLACTLAACGGTDDSAGGTDGEPTPAPEPTTDTVGTESDTSEPTGGPDVPAPEPSMEPSCDPEEDPDCDELFYCKTDDDCADVLTSLPECVVGQCDTATNTCQAVQDDSPECDEIADTPPAGTICKITGESGTLVSCDVAAVRANEAVPGPLGLSFEIHYPGALLRFAGLQALPCADGSCDPVDVPPAALVTGHDVSLTPEASADWAQSGTVALHPAEGDTTTLVTSAFLQADGTVSGNTQVVQAIFELNVSSSTNLWVELRNPAADSTDGTALTAEISDGRILISGESALSDCGDGTCSPDETCESCAAYCGECPTDCGNATCDADESCENCPEDCGECPAPECGDTVCDADETCESCPADCGECPANCGNATCDADETCDNCPADCGECPAPCGDGTCGEDETCADCPADCGECPADCGNGTCDADETCETCAEDCGECPSGCELGPVVTPTDDQLCVIAGCAGQTVDCFIRVAHQSPTGPFVSGLQMLLNYPSAQVTLENFYDSWCLDMTTCFEVPLAQPGAQSSASGHSWTFSPSGDAASGEGWAGQVALLIANLSAPNFPLSTASVDGAGNITDQLPCMMYDAAGPTMNEAADVVCDSVIATARFTLLTDLPYANSAHLTVNTTPDKLVAAGTTQEMASAVQDGVIVITAP